MLTSKSTVKSKPSKKASKKMATKEFDMTPAGKVIYYPHLAGLPIRNGSKLTLNHIVKAIESVTADGAWCSWYSTEIWTTNVKCSAGYTACHAGLNDSFENSFYLDLINWQKLAEKSIPNAKKIYDMLVSKDSPWADAIQNAYLIYNEEGDRLLGIYMEDLGRDVPEGCRRLFVNLLIALRCVSEHRAHRDAYAAKANPFGTLLGWFINASIDSGYGHNWTYYNEKGASWIKKLFGKQHSNAKYPKQKDVFSSYCNGVFFGEGAEMVGADLIKKVEKELGYV